MVARLQVAFDQRSKPRIEAKTERLSLEVQVRAAASGQTILGFSGQFGGTPVARDACPTREAQEPWCTRRGPVLVELDVAGRGNGKLAITHGEDDSLETNYGDHSARIRS